MDSNASRHGEEHGESSESADDLNRQPPREERTEATTQSAGDAKKSKTRRTEADKIRVPDWLTHPQATQWQIALCDKVVNASSHSDAKEMQWLKYVWVLFARTDLTFEELFR